MKNKITFVGQFTEKLHDGRLIDSYLFRAANIALTVGVEKRKEIEIKKTYEVELELFGKAKYTQSGKKAHHNCLDLVSFKGVNNHEN